MVKLPVLCRKRQEAKIVNDRMSLGTLGVREGKGLNNTGNMWSGRKKGIENPLKKVIASTFLGGKEFIKRIKMEYLEKKEIDRRDLPALRKILKGPSLESIEKAVIKIVGREHLLFKKICIYLSYQRSGLNLREIGEYFGM